MKRSWLGAVIGTYLLIAPATAQDAVPALSMEVIRDQCIEFAEVKQGNGIAEYNECNVSEFGEFGAVDGHTYYFALYCLMPNWRTAVGKCGDDSFTARYHRGRALAVFSRNPSNGNVQLVFERAEPEIGVVLYSRPEIIQNPAGTLLILPITVDGTGNGNVSEYYMRDSGRWEQIETEAWLSDLGNRLPAGLRIAKGVWPDLRTMRAGAGLYRAGDANCCPTGGTARIRLAIRGMRLVIESLVVEEAP